MVNIANPPSYNSLTNMPAALHDDAALYIFSTQKRGISSHQPASDFGVRQQTACFNLCRIRYAFRLMADTTISRTVQAAETCGGGKNNIGHKDTIAVSDKCSAYFELSGNHDRKVFNHNASEYCKEGFHTNGIESIWRLLKRGKYGML